MESKTHQINSKAGKTNSQGFFFAAVIVVTGLIAYSNSFNGEFVFDDVSNIVDNPSIRKLWPLVDALKAPLGSGVAGRPIINFSLAINYAISGEKVWSYHLFNFLIHTFAALALYGILRISFLSEKLPERYHVASTNLALGCALIWMVHPLQTQSVTYTIQRCESLMGLCFLLTLYCAIRGWRSGRTGLWHLAALLSFFVGIGAKEVIIVAPFMVFLYDLLFVHDGAKEALKKSQLLYAGLVFGLILIGLQVAAGGTVDSGPFKVTFGPLQYALTQCQIVFQYITLSFWPHELCIDYYWSIIQPVEAFPFVLLVLTLLFCSIWSVLKRNLLGFAAIWFLAILAPTSSIMPLDEIISEHRMYLPLAGLVVITVVSVYEAGRRVFSHLPLSKAHYNSVSRLSGLGLLAITIGVLTVLTFVRNSDYKNSVSIWTDTVKKQPRNPRAHYNLGCALAELEQYQDSVVYFQEAVRIRPSFFDAQKNLAIIFIRLNEPEKAVLPLLNALKLRPDSADVHYSFGTAMVKLSKPQEAVGHFLRTLEIQWNYPDAHNHLGVALAMMEKWQEAISHFRKAIDMEPNNASAESNLQLALTAKRHSKGNNQAFYGTGPDEN